MTTKAEQLRAMRERQAEEWERLQAKTRRMTRKLVATRAELDQAVRDAAAKVAKPKTRRRK